MVDWGIRVASEPRFGGGHVARCVALAQAMRSRGEANVVFFTDPGDPQPAALAAARFPCRPERSPGTVDAVLTELRNGSIGAVVCDSYAVLEEAIGLLARECPLSVFRDDGRRGAEQTTIDIHPGALVGASVIAGPSFAPLDPAFAAARASIDQIERAAATGPHNVLVAFGLRDSGGTAAAVVKALSQVSSVISITVAAASASPNHARLAALVQSGSNSRLVVDAADMVPLYRAADLAIGAPGSSQFERACCGVPTVIVPQSIGQRPLAQAWNASGAAAYAADPSEAAKRVAELIADPQARVSIRERAMALVDGRGAERLAAALTKRVTALAA